MFESDRDAVADNRLPLCDAPVRPGRKPDGSVRDRIDRVHVGASRQPDRELAGMTGIVELRVLELLTARLCHELISPIAAINNGVEILAEEESGFAADAVRLVADSARRAGARLQFFRFAYGAAPGGGLSGPPPHELAQGYFAATRIACDYEESARRLALEWQKLGCNLLLVGAEALPRGGGLTLRAGACGPEVALSGAAAGLPAEMAVALALSCPAAALTTRTVQGYFAGLLARALGCRPIVAGAPENLRLTVAPEA